ncbi:MAG: proton-conducting transporter membrane subunit, partial [Methanocellales archaeon]|nr:proton-conducting transporter membrane subunit [Methanocellales archaeon]
MAEIAHEVVHEVVEMAHVHVSALPAWAVLAPLIGALLVYTIGRKSEKARDYLAVAVTIVTFGLVAAMYPFIVAGDKVVYTIHSAMLLYDAGFVVDPLAFLIAAVTTFVWMLATIYALGYMSHEHARNRFYTFSLLTLGVDLGVLLAGDLFLLFIFFELLAIFSYILVIHEETPEAMSAGKKYLFIGIVGGLFLLGGIVLLYTYSGTLEIVPELGKIAHLGNVKYLICALMVIGFGCKAGIFPVHVWLPEAHPIAPTPASALLSGVMIKAGAYGIFRTVNLIFTPAEVGEVVSHAIAHSPAVVEQIPIWSISANVGYAVIWIGVITMFMGVILALLQENSKRMLAYHSISQMGYIVLGVGCAAYLGYEGAIGLAGGLYHVINHALFKALLFLTVGAVYFRTGELNMYKLGGMWRNMPITAMCCFIAVMGISGVPGFNGFASKTLLHHAIVESYEHHGDMWLRFAEIIFMVTAGGTFASNIKMFIFIFLGKRPEKYKDAKPAPLSMKIAMGALAVSIVLIGVMPNLLMKIIAPATGYHTFTAHNVEHLAEYGMYATKLLVPVDMLGGGAALVMGGFIFITGIRGGWFHWHLPHWIGPDYWYGNIARGFVWFCKNPTATFAMWIDQAFIEVGRGFIWFCKNP